MSTDSFQQSSGAADLAIAVPQQSRGRGTYVQQACSICRTKKVRCDGRRPACTTCENSNRADECSWSKDSTPLRKNRTEAYFESLKKRLNASEEYCAYLVAELERCRREHGGGGASSSDDTYLARRPSELNDTSLDDVDPTDYGEDRDPADSSQAIHDLIAPIQRLTLLEGGEGLISYGSTSVFRFRPIPLAQLNLPSRFPAIVENPDDTYVLLLEGTDERHYNPDLEWSRHLPTSVALDRRAHDKALDLFFKFLASWCLRVVPPLFLRDMYRALAAPKSQTPPKTAHYSPMLHNAILALALAFLDDPAVRDFKSRQTFAEEAKKYIEAEASKPSLCTVNALATIATFHSSQGDQTLGFMYFGMSARMSQALGLDVDCSEWLKLGLIEPTDILDRYWTYWTTFAQDVNWSLFVGRDFCVRAPSQNDFRDMPIPFVDTDLDQLPFHHPPSGVPSQPNYLSKTFASTCQLLLIARRIMNVVNGIGKTRAHPAVIDKLIADIDLELNTWKASLPLEVDLTPKNRMTATPQKLMMHMAYWWQFILLHRPYFHKNGKVIHSSDKAIDHSKLCKRSAEHIMEILEIWKKLYTLRYVPITLVQPLFAAGTVFLLSGVQAASGTRVAHKELKHSIDSLTLLLQYLRDVGKSWQCALNIESILRALIDEQLKPSVQKRGATMPKDRSTSESGERISAYTTNPPSRRLSQNGPRRSRPRQSSNPSSGSGSSRGRSVQADKESQNSGSPTIAVHPALGDDTPMGDATFKQQNGFYHHQSQSDSQQAFNSMLTPSWVSGSPTASTSTSAPIQITRPRSRSTGHSVSGTSPIGITSPGSVKAPPSPALSTASSRMSMPSPGSPSQPFFHETPYLSNGGVFDQRQAQQAQSSSQSTAIGNNASLTNSLSMDQDTLVGLISSLDGGEAVNHYDFNTFQMSRFLAMPSGQNLSGVPFVGPFTIGESVGSLQQDMMQIPTPISSTAENTSPDGTFDFSMFNGMAAGGTDLLFGHDGGFGMNGFYGATNGAQGHQFLSGGSPVGGHSHRRAVSEDTRPGKTSTNGGYGELRLFQNDFNLPF